MAKGDGTYTPTKEDAKLLHYFTRDTVGVSDYNDHDSLAKWDYVLNPENNTVVLGQRVKVVYDANADNAKFEDGNITVEAYLDVKSYDLIKSKKATLAQNQHYFIDFKNGYYVARYLMWNFVERQTYLYGHMENTNGNRNRGISPSDIMMRGEQDNLPAEFKNISTV